jgi:excisionase family DNA binding protein
VTATVKRELMTPAEVAVLFGRVSPRTVVRWEQEGRLTGVRIIRTPGGHRRYYREDVERLVAETRGCVVSDVALPPCDQDADLPPVDSRVRHVSSGRLGAVHGRDPIRSTVLVLRDHAFFAEVYPAADWEVVP